MPALPLKRKLRKASVHDAPPAKRLRKPIVDLSTAFRFEAVSKRIKRLSVAPVSLLARQGERANICSEDSEDDYCDENQTPLSRVLMEQSLGDSSETFATFARDIRHLCRTVPLVLHHRTVITDRISLALEGGEGADLAHSALTCVQFVLLCPTNLCAKWLEQSGPCPFGHAT